MCTFYYISMFYLRYYNKLGAEEWQLDEHIGNSNGQRLISNDIGKI